MIAVELYLVISMPIAAFLLMIRAAVTAVKRVANALT